MTYTLIYSRVDPGIQCKDSDCDILLRAERKTRIKIEGEVTPVHEQT